MKINLLSKTVLDEYKTPKQTPLYQSIFEIEQQLIEKLVELGYSNAPKLQPNEDLLENLKKQIEALNTKKLNQNFSFTSRSEWIDFYKNYLDGEDSSIEKKIKTIQLEYFRPLEGDSKYLKENVFLIDKECLDNNSWQIFYHLNSFSELEIKQISILINGFPLIHIMLFPPRTRMESAYKFFHSKIVNSLSGMFEYIHIFVLSNGTKTKWFVADIKKISDSINTIQDFENITNFWTDQNHEPICNISDFAQHFLKKEVIFNLLVKYCIVTETKLIVLKPYQIDAAESIFNHIINNWDNSGNKSAGGYIWHSTGSGKTLTAFMSCKLIQKISGIQKIFLLEDRNALEFQVNKEFERFGSGQDYANSGIIWASRGDKLSQVLQDWHQYRYSKIVLTTIQKLYKFCEDEKKTSDFFNQKVVFIIDECHRDNFGKMHAQIIKKFKQYFIFGFTGTPIFDLNASFPKDTTENYFGNQIGPSYTLYRSIKDGNSLPFHYFETLDENEMEEERLSIKNNSSPLSEQKEIERRIKKIAHTVLSEFKSKTIKNGEKFNSILAAKNIPQAIRCYEEIKKLNEANLGGDKLFIACVFTGAAEYKEKYKEIREAFAKEFMSIYKETTQDHEKNRKLRTMQEDGYKEVVTEAFKERKIDLLIVSDMFLTGFDAPKLNTLWLDKPSIKWHTLIQTFSRTNRPHKNKESGVIVSFNHISDNLDEAINLFSAKEDYKGEIYKKFSPEEFKKDREELETQIQKLKQLEKEIQLSEGDSKNKTEFIRTCKDAEKNAKRLRNYGVLWRENFGEERENEVNKLSEFKEQLLLERSLERQKMRKNDLSLIAEENPEQYLELEDDEEYDLDIKSFSLERSGIKINENYIQLQDLLKTARCTSRAIKSIKQAIKSGDRDLIKTPGWISKKVNLSYHNPQREKIISEIIKLAIDLIDKNKDQKAEILDFSAVED